MAPETHLQDTDKRQFDQQFDLDAAMWYGAISTGPFSDAIWKIFHMFFCGGIVYQTGSGWADWAGNAFGNLASLLSHGQRVLVQLPNARMGGGELWPWLNAGGEIPPRGFATHGIASVSTPRELIKGHRQYVEEKHGNWQSVKGHFQSRHFAFNPALGGEGNRNPFSSSNDDTKPTYTPIKANGLNGHVYINYLPPDDRQAGGLLIGCENAEHGRGTNPHTGAGHGLGGSQKVSACGGKKWSSLRCGPTAEYNGLVCDLCDRGPDLGWLLGRQLFDFENLDGSPMPVPTIGPPAGLDRDLREALARRRTAITGND